MLDTSVDAYFREAAPPLPVTTVPLTQLARSDIRGGFQIHDYAPIRSVCGSEQPGRSVTTQSGDMGYRTPVPGKGGAFC